MPVETIYGSSDGLPIDTRIAWGRDCEYVQVATLHDQGAKAILAVVNSWLENAGKPVIDVEDLIVGLAGSEVAAAFDGWHCTLTKRSDVNAMIAALRRARDHAFGRDE